MVNSMAKLPKDILSKIYGLLDGEALVALASTQHFFFNSLRCNPDASRAICSYLTPTRQYKVMILGSGGVGKSTATLLLCSGRFIEDYDPTIEDDYVAEKMIGGRSYQLQMIDGMPHDCDGYSRRREGEILKSMDGFLLMYSISSRYSYDDLLNRRVSILDAKGVKGPPPPIVLVGNKLDLGDMREVSSSDAALMAAVYSSCPFLEVSHKTPTNVDEMWQVVVNALDEAKEAESAAKREKAEKRQCSLC